MEKRARAMRRGAMALALACAVSAAAWMFSSRWTVFRMSQFGEALGLKSGVVFYAGTTDQLRTQLVSKFGHESVRRWEWHLTRRVPAMEWGGGAYSSTPSGRWQVRILLWPVILASGVGSVLLFRLSRRPGPGHCQMCGYDLKGTPGRCPECGEIEASKPDRS